MAISDAVGLERISRVVGYKLTKGDFSETSPNLPQRIAVFAEANTANQSAVTDYNPLRITSAQQAGTVYGFGSPAHIVARILFPVGGGGSIGGIPVYVYPQAEQGGATANIQTITVTGTATGSGTHNLIINGRYSLDGGSYAINIVSGDTATQIASKIYDVINNVLGCPVTAAQASPVSGVITTTSKWKGLTAAGISIEVDRGENTLGVSYAVATSNAGSGSPTVTNSLNLFGSEWVTEVINSYGFNEDIMEEFEAFNGKPDPTNPTGRYASIIFKPFLALTGTTLDTDTGTADTIFCDADKTNVTIAPCPAPLSKGLPMEAAANMCALFARITQDTPHLDVEGLSYPDMPVPRTGVPAMCDYDVRDAVVKMGMSTVDVVAGAYQVQDFVTTYHPTGEIPPQFRYCRNLMLDFNVRYTYYLLEQTYLISKALAGDNDNVNVSGVMKPKVWKGIVSQMATDLGKRALIADVPFMQNSITTGISTSNPDRLETFFRYKRTGTTRISSTTAQAGFNFGTV